MLKASTTIQKITTSIPDRERERERSTLSRVQLVYTPYSAHMSPENTHKNNYIMDILILGAILQYMVSVSLSYRVYRVHNYCRGITTLTDNHQPDSIPSRALLAVRQCQVNTISSGTLSTHIALPVVDTLIIWLAVYIQTASTRSFLRAIKEG